MHTLDTAKTASWSGGRSAPLTRPIRLKHRLVSITNTFLSVNLESKQSALECLLCCPFLIARNAFLTVHPSLADLVPNEHTPF